MLSFISKFLRTLFLSTILHFNLVAQSDFIIIQVKGEKDEGSVDNTLWIQDEADTILVYNSFKNIEVSSVVSIDQKLFFEIGNIFFYNYKSKPIELSENFKWGTVVIYLANRSIGVKKQITIYNISKSIKYLKKCIKKLSNVQNGSDINVILEYYIVVFEND